MATPINDHIFVEEVSDLLDIAIGMAPPRFCVATISNALDAIVWAQVEAGDLEYARHLGAVGEKVLEFITEERYRHDVRFADAKAGPFLARGCEIEWKAGGIISKPISLLPRV